MTTYLKDGQRFTVQQLRLLYAGVSLPDGGDMGAYGYAELVATTPPDALPGYQMQEGTPNGNRQTWVQVPYDRTQIAANIRAIRDEYSDTGGYKVVVGGVDKWFHSDTKSRTQQLALVILAANVPPVKWKTMDKSFVTMSQALAGQIFQSAITQDMTIFAVAQSHTVALGASEDPANYDYSTGWPATFTTAAAPDAPVITVKVASTIG